MRRKTGQVSFEFTLSMVIGMMVVVGLLAMFAGKLNDVMQETHDQQIMTILGMLSDEVDFAKGSPEGYTRVFALPVTVDGRNYSVNFTNATVFTTTIAISSDGRDFTTGFNYPINTSICLEALNETTKYFEVRRTANEVVLNNCPDCEVDYDDCFYYDSINSCGSLGSLEEQCGRYCLC
jgi:hypothetical protein